VADNKKPRILSRDAIRALDDRVRELVEVPEWGGALYVRAMTALEREQFEQSLLDQRRGKNRLRLEYARARLAVMVCEDEGGKPIFEDADVAWLATKSAAALERIFKVASRLSGLDEDDLDALAKN